MRLSRVKSPLARLLLGCAALLVALTALLLVADTPHFWTAFGFSAAGVAFVAGWGLAVSKYSLSEFQSFFAELSLFAPLLVFVVAFIAFSELMNRDPSSTDFHAAAAQLIPLVALALALQGRGIRVVQRTSDIYILILTFYLLGVGEF